MPKQHRPEIRFDDAGFFVDTGQASHSYASLQWREVTTALAYKRDIYAMDLICLQFCTAEATIEIHEQMPGWSQLIEQLPSRLPVWLRFQINGNA